MTLVSVVLYVHILAVLLLVSAFSVEALMLTRLRRVATISEAHLWLTLVPTLPRMVIGSLLVLLLSGSYLTSKMSAWSLGWPKVAVGGLVLVALLGGATGTRMRAILRGMANSEGEASTSLHRFRDPFFKFSLHVRLWVVVGMVLLMTAKPGLAESLASVAAAAMAGSLSARFGSRPEPVGSALGSNVSR